MLKKSSLWLVEMIDEVLMEMVSVLRLLVFSWPDNMSLSDEKAKEDSLAAYLLKIN